MGGQEIREEILERVVNGMSRVSGSSDGPPGQILRRWIWGPLPCEAGLQCVTTEEDGRMISSGELLTVLGDRDPISSGIRSFFAGTTGLRTW